MATQKDPPRKAGTQNKTNPVRLAIQKDQPRKAGTQNKTGLRQHCNAAISKRTKRSPVRL
ncbi:MAG: hypothetical protein JNK00_05565 [Flavipsychrobacter sp.]|nr:hypothetical protein [Flavipsychrobacter sp.]